MIDLLSARSHLPSSTQGKPLTQITSLPVSHSCQCLPHPCPPSRLIIPKTLSPWDSQVCLFMDRELPDEARGHSQGKLLHPSAFRPHEVMIKDQHAASFLKPSTKYKKLNMHKLISTRQRTKSPISQACSHSKHISILDSELRITGGTLLNSPVFGRFHQRTTKGDMENWGGGKSITPRSPHLPPTYTKSHMCHLERRE